MRFSSGDVDEHENMAIVVHAGQSQMTDKTDLLNYGLKVSFQMAMSTLFRLLMEDF